MDPKNCLKVVDLFAGCGGLSLGLENANFYPVFVNELNADARATYIRNRRAINPRLEHPAFHEADVKAMVLDESYTRRMKERFKKEFHFGHGELDLLVGGPPCQGFSGIGHRRSYSVDKKQLPSNHLFQDMAVLVHRLKPRAFLFENVRGLLTSRWTERGEKGEIWREVFKAFSDIPDYTVTYKLVYAKDYGVPQNRPRVLMVGIRNDVLPPALRGGHETLDAVERGFLPAPPKGIRAPHPVELLNDLVDDAYPEVRVTLKYPKAAKTKIQQQLRTTREGKLLRKGELVSEHEYSNHAPHIAQKFKAMIASGGVVPEQFKTKKFAQRVLPCRWEKEGPTITATSLPDDYVHFEQPRILTVREWARLQMFPDWYEFMGKRSTGGIRRAGNPREGVFDREVPKYTQIGNAVPVGLAEAVGKHLAAILRK